MWRMGLGMDWGRNSWWNEGGDEDCAVCADLKQRQHSLPNMNHSIQPAFTWPDYFYFQVLKSYIQRNWRGILRWSCSTQHISTKGRWPTHIVLLAFSKNAHEEAYVTTGSNIMPANVETYVCCASYSCCRTVPCSLVQLVAPRCFGEEKIREREGVSCVPGHYVDWICWWLSYNAHWHFWTKRWYQKYTKDTLLATSRTRSG